MQRQGRVEEACNERFHAFQRISELLPEDEEVILEWEDPNTRAALEVIHASAIDHFLINDFEMSTAMLELLLELDPEDHLEAIILLAFNYLAMEEYELFDEVSNDISDKYACKEVLTMWAAFRRSGRIPEGDAIRFRTRFAPYLPNLPPTNILPTGSTWRISRASALRCRPRLVSCGSALKISGRFSRFYCGASKVAPPDFLRGEVAGKGVCAVYRASCYERRAICEGISPILRIRPA